MSAYYEYLANTNIRNRRLYNTSHPLTHRYLEISGRRSGKTTRLVDAIIDFMRIKKEEDIVVCCSMNRQMNSILKDKILPQINDSASLIGSYVAPGLIFGIPDECIGMLSYFSRNADVNVYFFLDEFCFFRLKDEYVIKNIAKRTLYASSSINNPNDVNDISTLVGYLFHLNDNNYQRYPSLPGVKEGVLE